MRQAASGDTVRVHYQGTLSDGTEFDNSVERGPIELTIGGGEVIPGFEIALVGMSEGDTKKITIEADGAYGPHNSEIVETVERTTIPEEIELQMGAVLQASDEKGNEIRLVVTELDDVNVTLDANHELAGHALTFELQLVEFVS